MNKEYFKTETFGDFTIKYFATPNLDNENCQFGFDVFLKNELFCSNHNCEFSLCNSLFDSEEDAYNEAKDCMQNCLSNQEELLNYISSEYIEEYPEDFEIKPVKH